jgi:hypothetical protein
MKNQDNQSTDRDSDLSAASGSVPLAEDHYECIYEDENPNMYANYDRQDGGGPTLNYVIWLEKRLGRAEAQNNHNQIKQWKT